MPEAAIVIDTQGIIVYVNRRWIDTPIHLGERLDDYLGLVYWDLNLGNDKLVQGINQVLQASMESFKCELLHYADGKSQIYSVRVTPIKDDKLKASGALLVYSNITELIGIECSFKSSAEQYRLIAEHSHDMIKVTDINGKIEYTSPSHKQLYGSTYEHIDIFETIHPDDNDTIKDAYAEMSKTKKTYVLELRRKNKCGEWAWLETVCSPILSDEGELLSVVIISRDISDRKRYEQELEYMAYYDYLTGLYNRRRLAIGIEEVLGNCINASSRMAVLVMDLNKFKNINDTYGHDVGDLVLKEFAKRLLDCKRESDIVGRMSGDEFALIMSKVDGELAVKQFIHEFQSFISKPYLIPNTSIKLEIRSSVGYSLFPEHGDSVRELMKHADIALYEEKEKQAKGIAQH